MIGGRLTNERDHASEPMILICCGLLVLGQERIGPTPRHTFRFSIAFGWPPSAPFGPHRPPAGRCPPPPPRGQRS